MSEVRQQAPHAATVGLQRGKVREWVGYFQFRIGVFGLWLHAQYLRMSLRFE